MKNTVVLMKTHVWSTELEVFATKIYNEIYKESNSNTESNKESTSFFILMHTEDNIIYEEVKNENLKKCILKFKESDIKSLYETGYFSMWLSNHWILMWFFKNFGQTYEWFWSFEYDVRICGDSSKIWNYNCNYDFLYTRGNYRNPTNKYLSYYVGTKLTNLEKYHGFLQMARYSKNCLKYLNECFENGENGQDELIVYSLLNRKGMSGSKKFLQSLIRGNWTWQTQFSNVNKRLYEKLENNPNNNTVAIFHPVK